MNQGTSVCAMMRGIPTSTRSTTPAQRVTLTRVSAILTAASIAILLAGCAHTGRLKYVAATISP